MNKEAVIQMETIRKEYHVGTQVLQVLKGISLEVYRGEYIAIMGPSGSGKSTLMNIIGCLDKSTSGTYVLDGQPISTLDDEGYARVRNEKIGFVFQSFNLLPRTSALDNAALPLLYAGVVSRTERLRRAEEALKAVGLGDRLYNKPNELSGGQQQRVSIARALINNPAIILADEPTGALDSKTTEEIMYIFQELHKQGRTIIMITHEHDVAQHAERIIHIRDGEIGKEEMVTQRRYAQ